MQDVQRPLPEWSMTRAAPSGATTRQLMRDARRVKRDLSEFRAVAFQDVGFEHESLTTPRPCRI